MRLIGVRGDFRALRDRIKGGSELRDDVKMRWDFADHQAKDGPPSMGRLIDEDLLGG